MSKWEHTKDRNTKGRWVICSSCNGHGKLYMEHGDVRYGTGNPCDYCETTGRRWQTKSSATEVRPSKKKR